MTAPDGFEAAYATAEHDLHNRVGEALQAGADADPARVGRAVAIELMARGVGVGVLVCLAGRAIAELASARAAIVEARRHPLGLPGQRHMTREVVEDIADDMRHVRAEDVCDG